MLQRWMAAAVGIVALVLLLGSRQAHEVQFGGGTNIPRDFRGAYEWSDGLGRYALALRIDRVERRGDLLHFSGSHGYALDDEAGGIVGTMKVNGTIDLDNYTLSMRESEPSQPGADIDGSFEGTIAEDMQTIEAVWTSRGNGREGTLTLRAVVAPGAR